MRLAAWAAVFVTIGITYCYYMGWFWPAFALTFLLAVQSAIYSPAKYGYIKNLFGKEHLAEANGLVQATTISAILLSTFAFSIIFESLFPQGSNPSNGLIAIAPIGWLLIINSLFELMMAYRLPQLDHHPSTEPFSYRDFFTGRDMIKNIQPIIGNPVIRLSVIGLAVFWSAGQVMLAAFPAFAKETLAVDNTIIIQGILAATGIGIALGSALAGAWSKGHIETGIIPIGATGIGIGLLLLPQLHSTAGHFFNFLFIGVMGGLFIVPLNSLMQFSAKNNELGKVIAGNNLIQNISMLGFLILTALFAIAGIESRLLLILIAVVAVIGCLYTLYQLPQSLVRWFISLITQRHYKVDVHDMKNIPGQGGVLLLGNHSSWIDWAIIQIASPRPIRFVLPKNIVERRYLKGLLSLMGCIPIQPNANSQQSLNTVAQLLDAGEVVCILPEQPINHQGVVEEPRIDYERACQLTHQEITIVPFYLRDLSDSELSTSPSKQKNSRNNGRVRDIAITFGKPLPKSTTANAIKDCVLHLSLKNQK